MAVHDYLMAARPVLFFIVQVGYWKLLSSEPLVCPSDGSWRPLEPPALHCGFGSGLRKGEGATPSSIEQDPNYNYPPALRTQINRVGSFQQSQPATLQFQNPVLAIVVLVVAGFVYSCLWPKFQEINNDQTRGGVNPRQSTFTRRHSTLTQSISPEEAELAKQRLWMRVIIVYMACVLAPGVLPIWPVVQPLFAQAGVFGDACAYRFGGCQQQQEMLSFVSLIAFAIMLTLTWPLGLAFDQLGPRGCATIGALLCCVAQGCLALTTVYPLEASWLLYPGAVLADFGGTMNAYALFGFLWHDPDYQGLISGLSSSNGSAGTLMALIAITMLPFSAALWMLCGSAFVAAVACWLYVPTLEEYRYESSRSLGCPPPDRGSQPITSQLSKKMAICKKCFMANYDDNWYFVCSLILLLSFYSYFTGVASPYLSLLLGNEASTDICNFCATAYGVVGLFLGPSSGMLSDKLGLKALVAIIAFLNLFQVSMVFVPDVTAQMMGGVAGSAFAALYVTYASRWFALYAPPDEFGNFSGFIMSFCGFASMLLSLVLYSSATSFLEGQAVYTVPLAVLAIGSASSMFMFLSHVYDRELPEAPPVLSDDES